VNLLPGEEIVFDGRPAWRGLLSLVVPGALAAVALAIGALLAAGLVAAVLVGAVVLIGVGGAGCERRLGTHYVATTRRLRIRRGIRAQRARQTRIARIRDVTTEQSRLDRVLRIGTVSFDAAGAGAGEFRFVRVAAPERVVAAVDSARRRAAERAAEPRFARRSGVAEGG
jgi:membrane protein YdbS with pleckstrin-like domain